MRREIADVLGLFFTKLKATQGSGHAQLLEEVFQEYAERDLSERLKDETFREELKQFEGSRPSPQVSTATASPCSARPSSNALFSRPGALKSVQSTCRPTRQTGRSSAGRKLDELLVLHY